MTVVLIALYCIILFNNLLTHNVTILDISEWEMAPRQRCYLAGETCRVFSKNCRSTRQPWSYPTLHICSYSSYCEVQKGKKYPLISLFGMRIVFLLFCVLFHYFIFFFNIASFISRYLYWFVMACSVQYLIINCSQSTSHWTILCRIKITIRGVGSSHTHSCKYCSSSHFNSLLDPFLNS